MVAEKLFVQPLGYFPLLLSLSLHIVISVSPEFFLVFAKNLTTLTVNWKHVLVLEENPHSVYEYFVNLIVVDIIFFVSSFWVGQIHILSYIYRIFNIDLIDYNFLLFLFY